VGSDCGAILNGRLSRHPRAKGQWVRSLEPDGVGTGRHAKSSKDDGVMCRGLAAQRQAESLVTQVPQQGKEDLTMLVARLSREPSKHLIAKRRSDTHAVTSPGAVDDIQVTRAASGCNSGRLACQR